MTEQNQNVLHYRKKSVWIFLVVGLCVTGAAVGVLHDPSGETDTQADSSQEDLLEEVHLTGNDRSETGVWLPDQLTTDRRRTYLLGEAEYWTLYGKGDYKSMLLERNGRYTQIGYPYMSSHQICPELMEADPGGTGVL